MKTNSQAHGEKDRTVYRSVIINAYDSFANETEKKNAFSARIVIVAFHLSSNSWRIHTHSVIKWDHAIDESERRATTKILYADMAGEMEITFNRIQNIYNEIEIKPERLLAWAKLTINANPKCAPFVQLKQNDFIS